MDNKKKKPTPIKIKGVSKKGKHPYVDLDPQDPDPKTLRKMCSEAVRKSLAEKSQNSDLTFSLLLEVFERGIEDYVNSDVILNRPEITAQQWAFARVNSFIAGGRALELDEDLCEAKEYRIGPKTSNKSLGRLARRNDHVGNSAMAELKRRKGTVVSKTAAAKTLHHVLHGKSKLTHSSAKTIVKTLGLPPKSAAAKTLTAVGREHERQKEMSNLRRQITREVTKKIKTKNAKSSENLVDALKKVQAAFVEPTKPQSPPPSSVPTSVPYPGKDMRSSPGSANLHLPKRNDINPDVGPRKQTKKKGGVLAKLSKLLKVR